MRDILDELRKIRYARFRLEMVAIDRLRLPPYKGSTLRGAFGHAFKKLGCVKRDLDCSTCLIRDRCVYYYVFETPFGGEGEPRGYTFAPHPFVIEPPEGAQRIYEPETEFQVGLILVGRALDYLPYFIYAFEDMGRRGLGIGRGKAALKQAAALYPGEERCIYQAETGRLVSDYPICAGPPAGEEVGARLRLRLRTPVRLKTEGGYAHGIDFALLVRALLRRSSALARFHCGAELDLNYRQWIEQAAEVRQVAAQVRWYDWERYSQRQERKIKLGGLVGEVEFAGEWGPFVPLLHLGTDLHVGKGTAFGLGRYEIMRAQGNAKII